MEDVLELELETPDDKEAADFIYTDYVSIFPKECASQLTATFANKSYGWKKRAFLVKRLAYHTDLVADISDELVELCTGKRTRKTTLQLQREAMYAMLHGLSDDVLEKLASEKNVSFSAFMHRDQPDKDGLIESILDKTLSA